MSRFTAADGTKLFYDDTGTGLPVLCLAGLTRNHRDFDHVLPYLQGCRVIRLDYRGRGASDWADPASYTIPQEAADTLALMDHLGLAQAAILGTSRGGLIAMGLAFGAKERLLGVALNDIGPEIAPEGLKMIERYLGRRPRARSFDEAVDLRASQLVGFSNVPKTRWRHDLEANFIETPEGLDLRYDPALREAVLDGGAQPVPDLWPYFDALEGLPLALIRGANSNLLSPGTAARMCAKRPDMSFAEVPDRGHVPFLDEPLAVQALGEWLGKMQ